MLESPSISSAYIHIPFCRRRCYYCDFPISVVGDRPPLQRSAGVRASESGHGSGAIADYVTLLCREIQATPHPANAPLNTVFLGGGTPSLLGIEQLGTILDTVAATFGLASDAEISMEMDPGTFDQRQLWGYSDAGINRVSLGVQSFDDEILAACGRTHRAADIDQAIALLHHSTIKNWSLDLISGLPHLTLDRWQDTVETALQYGPTHLSIYDLTLEANTAFDRWYTPGQSPLPSDDLTATMYRWAVQRLREAGYKHYEISNYAQSGYESRHNCVYWHNSPYYGFGMGAASYVNHYRFTRPRTRKQYAEWVSQWVSSLEAGTTPWPCEATAPDEQLLDQLMLGLRLADGLDLQPLVQQFGEAIASPILDTLKPYERKGWVTLHRTDSPDPDSPGPDSPDPGSCHHWHIRLTDPEGFLFSNTILSSLFNALESDILDSLLLVDV